MRRINPLSFLLRGLSRQLLQAELQLEQLQLLREALQRSDLPGLPVPLHSSQLPVPPVEVLLEKTPK